MSDRLDAASDAAWGWLYFLPSPALAFDGSALIVRANPLIESALGYSVEELRGQPVDFLVPDYLLPDPSTLAAWLETGPSSASAGIDIDLLAQRNDGTVLPVEVHLGPVVVSSENYTLAIIRDAPGRQTDAELGETQVRELLVDIGRIIGASLDLESVCEQFAMALMRALPAERVAICTVAPGADTYELAYVSGRVGQGLSRGSTSRLSGSPAGAAIESRAPLLISGLELEEMAHDNPQLALQIELGLRWMASVPLIVNNDCIGALLLSSSRDDAFSTGDLDLLEQIAHQIAGVLRAVKLYAEQQREAEIRRSLAAIGVAGSRDLDLDRVFERVADELAELIHYDRVSVVVVDPDDPTQRRAFEIGVELPTSAGGNAGRAEDGERLEWRSAAYGNHLESDDSEALAAVGLESCVEVSLGTEVGGAIGHLSIMSRERDAYTSRDLELMGLVANQITPAIQNALAHTHALQLAEAREQQVILEARSRELEQVNKAKSQFLALVSHELRTPLTSITAFSAILLKNKEQNLTEMQAKQLQAVRRNAAKLNYLIGDLLDVSCMELGTLKLDTTVFDVNTLLEELVESFVPIVASKSQNIEHVIGSSDLLISGDRQRVSQIFSNLLENASKYSPEGSPIRIEASRLDGRVVVTVHDSGQGISKEDQEQLFDPFYRADNDQTRATSGSGLGLALVKRLAELHGGSVSVESEVGRGSAFSVSLPAVYAKAA